MIPTGGKRTSKARAGETLPPITRKRSAHSGHCLLSGKRKDALPSLKPPAPSRFVVTEEDDELSGNRPRRARGPFGVGEVDHGCTSRWRRMSDALVLNGSCTK